MKNKLNVIIKYLKIVQNWDKSPVEVYLNFLFFLLSFIIRPLGSYEQTTDSFCNLKREGYILRKRTLRMICITRMRRIRTSFDGTWKVFENVLPMIINQSAFAINPAILMFKIFLDTFNIFIYRFSTLLVWVLLTNCMFMLIFQY